MIIFFFLLIYVTIIYMKGIGGKMEVYFKDKDKIYKYSVSYDEIKMRLFRSKIIEDFSKISHIVEEREHSPYWYGKPVNKEIRNYKTPVCVGSVEYDTATESLERYEYDLYEYPYIIKLIDDFISGKVESLYKIYNFDLENDGEVSIDDKIALKNRELGDEGISVNNKKSILKELEKLYDQKKLNEGQRKVCKEDYLKLQSLLVVDFIAEMSLEEVERAKAFFNTDINGLIFDEDFMKLNSGVSRKREIKKND